LHARMHRANIRDIEPARRNGIINDAEAAQLRIAAQAVAAAVAVDDFAPEELSARRASGDVLSQPITPLSRPTAAE
jgi:acyl-CoA dehydrogenase